MRHKQTLWLLWLLFGIRLDFHSSRMRDFDAAPRHRQCLILSRWNPLFAHIPVESLIFERRPDHYAALNDSTQRSDSAVFIEFMLHAILAAMLAAAPQVTPQVTPQVERLIAVLTGEMAREEIQALLGLRDRKSFRERYLKPALEEGWIEYTLPEKPTSRLQKYRLTGKVRPVPAPHHRNA